MKRATTKAVIAAFGERLSDEGLALGTIRDYQRCIRLWAKWLSSRSTSLRRAKPEDLRALLFSLESAYVASERGEELPPGIPPWIQPLQWQSRAKLLAAIYRLNDYLVDEFPGVKRFRRQVFFARSRRRIPRVLSEFEIEQLLNQPNTGTVLGLRDRALLELMYAAGLRASEVASLELGQLDLHRGTATVDGKGARQRMVIFGESARDWCRRYLREARPLLANGSRRKLFLNRFGRPLTRDGIHYAVSKHARAARLSHVSPHTLRHTFATHLVAGGADIVAVQQLLGHAMIDTTEIYTHVSNVRLAMLHAIHHPR